VQNRSLVVGALVTVGGRGSVVLRQVKMTLSSMLSHAGWSTRQRAWHSSAERLSLVAQK
jgi:hypothetical protein